MKIPETLCQCGCGQTTTIAKKNHTRNGYIKGKPMKYINGHYVRGRNGSDNGNWGGGKKLSQGYVHILKPSHPKADPKGYIAEHILVAEEALGKLLPNGAVVHHVNENRSDNQKANLIICENDAYHKLLHRRMRALKACGHANWRKCKYCKEYDILENLFIAKNGNVYHNKCINKYHRQLRMHQKFLF